MKRAFVAAFPLTLPILAGFWFLGLAYGIYMHNLGFSFLYPMLMSLLIFAGSMEFVTASLLLGGFHPFQAFLLTLLVNSRHLFYGISMLEKFRGTGKFKPYLIFGMCDESFAINYNAVIPPGVDRTWFMFFVTLLNQFYWVSGATMGALAGNLMDCRLKGVEFVMTTLFVVIWLEQFLRERRVIPAISGVLLPLLALLCFGREHFIIPSMLLILGTLTLCRKQIERGERK